MIRCLVTDFGRVIGTFESRVEVLRKLAITLKTPLSESDFSFEKIFKVSGTTIGTDQEIYYESLDTGSYDLEDLWLRFLWHFKIKGKNCPYEMFKTEWCKHLQLIQPVVSLYRIIQEKYFLVGISNGDVVSLEYFTELLQNKGHLHFDALFLSGQRRVKKPKLFDIAAAELTSLDIDPRDCLYVDDRLIYVHEARRRMFRAFQFDSTAHSSFEEAACNLKSALIKRGMEL